MSNSIITQLASLLQKNPQLLQQLMTVKNINDAVALVKQQGVNIAQQELQQYMVQNLSKSVIGSLAGGAAAAGTTSKAGGAADIAGSVLQGLAGAAGSKQSAAASVAGSVLGGLFGKK